MYVAKLLNFDEHAQGLRRPTAEAVVRQLRADILEGRLKPGERLRQEALALRLGTSRIPIREALHRLEMEGLVRIVPHAGARVFKLTMQELDEIYRLRERLDPLAVSLSVPNLSSDQIDDLRKKLATLDAISPNRVADDPAQWIQLDLEFHLGTYAGAEAPRIRDLVRGLLYNAQPYRRMCLACKPDLDLQRAEHHLLLDAIERRDAQGAEVILQGHIRRTRFMLVSHPEIFAAD